MSTDNEKVFTAFMINSIFSYKIRGQSPVCTNNITSETVVWLERYLYTNSTCSGKVYNLLKGYKTFIEASSSSFFGTPKAIVQCGAFRSWLNNLPKNVLENSLETSDELKKASNKACSYGNGGMNMSLQEILDTLQDYDI